MSNLEDLAHIEKRALAVPDLLDWGDDDSLIDPTSEDAAINKFFTSARRWVLGLIRLCREQQAEIDELKGRVAELEIARLKVMEQQ